MDIAKASNREKVESEFLYLDLDVCTCCKGTDANLETALGEVKAVLEASGTEVAVRKVLMDSEATARKYRFVSSPTIRVNGRDIALELKETPCDSLTLLNRAHGKESVCCLHRQKSDRKFTLL